MRNESKPANPGARVRVQKLLIILALACSSRVSVTAVEAAGSAAPLQGTAHNDGRGTPKLVLPVPAESKVANNREGAEQFLRSRQAEFKLPADLSNLELVAARELPSVREVASNLPEAGKPPTLNEVKPPALCQLPAVFCPLAPDS